MKISDLRLFIRSNVENFAGSKATMKGTLLGQDFAISGMLSSTWQNSIPICTVRNIDKNTANIAIPFKQIKSIVKTKKTFDDAYLLELDIDLESRDFYSHTSRDRVVFEIVLKTNDKIEVWINPSEEYANTKNILAKMQS